MGVKGVYSYDLDKLVSLCNGERTSTQIAELVGCPVKYVQKMMLKLDLPRLKKGAMRGEGNHQYIAGRRMNKAGYVIVSAPDNHPHAKKRKGRLTHNIFEHRLVMEEKLGRYLEPTEIVDHIDGLHLHNHPGNLRLFPSNAHHLTETLKGCVPNWSSEGYHRMTLPHHQRKGLKLVDTYCQRKERGEIRVQQILLAALSLGIDSPYLSGTLHHLKNIQIDYSSQTKIKQALDSLYQKWELDHQ